MTKAEQMNVADEEKTSTGGDMDEYEHLFSEIDSKLEAIRSSFGRDDSDVDPSSGISLLQLRIEELEKGQDAKLDQLHVLNKRLQDETTKSSLLKKKREMGRKQLEDEMNRASQLEASLRHKIKELENAKHIEDGDDPDPNSLDLLELSNQLAISKAQNEVHLKNIDRIERQSKILADQVSELETDQNEKMLLLKDLESIIEKERKLNMKLEEDSQAYTKERLLFTQQLKDEAARSREMEELMKRQENNVKEQSQKLKEVIMENSRLKDVEASLVEEKKALQLQVHVQAKRAEELQTKNKELEEEISAHLKIQEGEGQDREELKSDLQRKDEALLSMRCENEKLLKLLKNKDTEIHKVSSEYEKMVLLMAEKNIAIEKAQNDLKIETEKFSQHVKDLKSGEERSELRLMEMSQQLESLYTAFGVINEEQSNERKERKSLETNLTLADHALAQQLDSPQRPTDMSRRTDWEGSNGAQAGHTSQEDIVAIRRILEEEERRNRESLNPPVQAYSIPGNFARAQDGPLMSGELMIRSNGRLKKWKNRYCWLHRYGNTSQLDSYKLDLGEGKTFIIVRGIASVDFNPNHPLSFIISVNPLDPKSPIICAAAASEDSYNQWMEALIRVTSH